MAGIGHSVRDIRLVFLDQRRTRHREAEQRGEPGSQEGPDGFHGVCALRVLRVEAEIADRRETLSLTSDSKLLFMDRTLIKSELTTVGLADNTIGLLLHGRPLAGHLEYSVGIFDNVAFEKVGANGDHESDQLMPAGRIVLHLLDPATSPDGYADYRESYIGQGQRLSIGANAAYLGKARVGNQQFDLHGWGVDVFFNTGPFSFQAEYDRFMENVIAADPDVHGDGWYVQAGYLWRYGIEFAARYQHLDPNGQFFEDRLRWTSLGVNLYIREHNLKIQTDYSFKREQGNELENDMFQMQLQMDF